MKKKKNKTNLSKTENVGLANSWGACRSPMRSYKQKFENHKGQEKPAYPVTTLKIGDTVREHYTAKHF